MPSRSRSKSGKVKRGSHVKSRRKSYTKKQCRAYLSRKIRENMHELKRGRWANRSQCIAVSFSQTQRRFPGCSRFLKRK